MKEIDVRDPALDLSAFRFVDVEASGLHAGSYPIEVAWSALDLSCLSMLVKPLDAWDEYDWSVQSEKVHGIVREELFASGEDARGCAEAMNGALAGMLVFSDAPGYDGKWLDRMFAETGVRREFRLYDLTDAQAACALRASPFYTEARELVEVLETVGRVYRHVHRAGPDSLAMAAGCRGLLDRDWFASLPPAPGA